LVKYLEITEFRLYLRPKTRKMANIKLFEEKSVRSSWNEQEEQWYFAIVDIISILTDSPNPQVYWRVLKKRLLDEGNQTVTNCNALKMEAMDGKMRLTDVANTQQLLRLIQSIPSPKAEPFKNWLAQVGSERIQEIENPELAAQRARALYKAKGYSEEWIEKRLRSILIREELTDEWQKHGVQEQREYSILTAEIAKATFGITPSQHKVFKKLKSQNLRDHMTDLELIFSMLGEAATTEIVKTNDPQGFEPNRAVAITGGSIAGNARKELELKLGKTVVSDNNFLPEKKSKKIDS
jgi:DNA-damage-inducible protein D